MITRDKHLSATSFSVLLLSALLLTLGTGAHAEQKERFGAYDVHYIIVPTLKLQPEIAAKYDITRGRDRGLLNISVLDAGDTPVAITLSGTSENLLGQRQNLRFQEVREGPAIYYLAVVRYADEEHHRVKVDIDLPDGEVAELRFQQKMYWKH